MSVKLHALIRFTLLALLLVLPVVAHAELVVPKVFGDHMVLQRDQPIHIWGTADPGANVQVKFGERDQTARANTDGKWSAELPPLPASTLARSLQVRSRGDSIDYDGILVGDVWLLGGQSNMEDVLESIYHGDTEVASANFPNIRLMTVPQAASPTPLDDIDRLNEFNSWTGRHELKGSWRACTPKAVSRFSAIGYIFGRRLHMVSGVPIGLIDASWGGTTAEAWTSREMLATIDMAKPLTEEWDNKIASYDPQANLQKRIEGWERATERRKKEAKPANRKPTEPDPSPAVNRNNPGASFNGMINPIAGLNIRGTIFNQGYNNALQHNARPQLYSKVFTAMIKDWRKAFRNDSLPFGIVALTAGGEPQTDATFEIRTADPAPFIREAQAKAFLELDNVGFAPAYDQQVPWYHPHKKFELGERIARWALNTQYGQSQIGWRPAVCIESKVVGETMELKFDRHVRVHDGRPFSGFSIAGLDQHFYPASAEFVVVGKDERGRDRVDESRLTISHPAVVEPIAVRYAWARNPLGNAVNAQHHERTIPIVSFRTDDWDWEDAPFETEGGDAMKQYRASVNKRRAAARKQTAKRLMDDAQRILKAGA